MLNENLVLDVAGATEVTLEELVASLTNEDPEDQAKEEPNDQDESDEVEIITNNEYILIRSYLWDAKLRLKNTFLESLPIEVFSELLNQGTLEDITAIEQEVLSRLELMISQEEDWTLEVINSDRTKDIAKVSKKAKSASFNLKRINKQKREKQLILTKYDTMHHLLKDNSLMIFIDDYEVEDDETGEFENEVVEAEDLNLENVLYSYLNPVIEVFKATGSFQEKLERTLENNMEEYIGKKIESELDNIVEKISTTLEDTMKKYVENKLELYTDAIRAITDNLEEERLYMEERIQDCED